MSFHPERPISTDRPRQKNVSDESTRFDLAKNPNNYWRSRCEQFPDAGSFNPQPTRSNRDNRKSFRSFTLLPSFPPPRIIPAKFPFGRENLIIDVILVTTTTPPLGGVCQINKNQRKINLRSPRRNYTKWPSPIRKYIFPSRGWKINSNRKISVFFNFPRAKRGANERTSYAITRVRTRTRWCLSWKQKFQTSAGKISKLADESRVHFTCGVLVVSSLLPRNEG